MIVAGLVVVVSALFIWYSRYTGQDFWVYWAPFFLTLVAFAVGVPVYRAERRRMLAPGGMPPYRPLGRDVQSCNAPGCSARQFSSRRPSQHVGRCARR